jgi:hypothetical protein
MKFQGVPDWTGRIYILCLAHLPNNIQNVKHGVRRQTLRYESRNSQRTELGLACSFPSGSGGASIFFGGCDSEEKAHGMVRKAGKTDDMKTQTSKRLVLAKFAQK